MIKLAAPVIIAAAALIAITAFSPQTYAAELAGFPEITTSFQFRSEDFTDPGSDRTTAVFALMLSSKMGFSTEALTGNFSVNYNGELLENELIGAGFAEVRSTQKYKINLGASTKDGRLSMGTELSTRDTYFRRDRFDSLLATETFQYVSGTITVSVPPYPVFTGAVSNERSVSRKIDPISSSQALSAVVAGTWNSGPLNLSVAKSRIESKNDFFGNPPTITEQTLVNGAAVLPLGGAWTMSNVLRYTEEERSLFFQSGASSKSITAVGQTTFSSGELAPGLSARVELRGENRTFTNETSNSSSFSQSANLTYKMPGEILGDDRWTLQFANTDTDSGGRSTNVQRHALGWQFFPASGASVAATYSGQTSTDNDLGRKNDERTAFDLRFGFAPGKLNLTGAYTFNLVEGAAGQESRLNTLGLSAGYQATDRLTLSTAINQYEDRNIPASPLGRVNVSDKTTWSFGANYRPLPELTMNASYSLDVQDNTAANKTDTRRLRFDMNYQITRQVKFTLFYDNTDYSRFGDPGAASRNSILQTQVTVTF